MFELPRVAIVKENGDPLEQKYPSCYWIDKGDKKPYNDIVQEILCSTNYDGVCILPSIYNFNHEKVLQHLIESFLNEEWYTNGQPIVVYGDMLIDTDVGLEYCYMPSRDTPQWDAQQIASIPLLVYKSNLIHDIQTLNLPNIVERVLNIHIPEALFDGNPGNT